MLVLHLLHLLMVADLSTFRVAPIVLHVAIVVNIVHLCVVLLGSLESLLTSWIVDQFLVCCMCVCVLLVSSQSRKVVAAAMT